MQVIIRLPEVKRRTGLSRSTLYARMDSKEFPQSIPLGGGLVGWLESEVTAWIQARVAERDDPAASSQAA
jgi:prophage regulatory protein